jgi:mannose-6-phosphate isomerase-like protein (cupin superfamily)
MVRRVVTGHDSGGKSIFVSDGDVAPYHPAIQPQSEFVRLWGGDGTPHFPDDGAPPAQAAYFAPIGGFRFGMFAIPPEGTPLPSGVDVAAGFEEMRRELPGMLDYMDPGDPGMHTTDTIDFEVVLDGTVELELDDGKFVTLQVGDTVVQNGTRHRWRNPGPGIARLAVFMCGAQHDNISGA